MKSIVIFTRTIDLNGYPFNDDYHWEAYLDLLLALKSRGVDAFFATNNDTYKGDGVFSVAFSASSKVRIPQFVKTFDVKADLVVEKGGFNGEDVAVLNPAYVHRITSDKAETYRNFAEFQPTSVICSNTGELDEAFAVIPGDMIVVKAPVSNKGEAVYIGSKTDVRVKIGNIFPLIVQEFIDTSVGIKNYVEGIHDVRVKIGGGEVFGGMIRTPAPGELRANLAQGGQARHLMPSALPPEVVRLALEIDKHFQNYPRYYALDFANTASGLKLIELNSKPGFSPMNISPQAKYVVDKLADYLVQLVSA
jgi:glutathione synthase/RimK-type ligase-like ATP-grasp enzyme